MGKSYRFIIVVAPEGQHYFKLAVGIVIVTVIMCCLIDQLNIVYED